MQHTYDKLVDPEHIYALALVTRTPIESWLTMGGIA